MIDETQLDILLRSVKKNPTECTSIFIGNNELIEIYRLARLGLWASSVGIPALKYYGFELVPDSINSGKTLITTATGYRARSSLNELPRDAS